jgi:subtilisin family serine protease
MAHATTSLWNRRSTRAVTDGAKVINMSLGGSDYSVSLNDTVQDAWNAGVVIVAGAGNDGTTAPFYPAALDNVVSVGAFDEDGARASFSNYGSWVDISAPGNLIMSTYPMAQCGLSTDAWRYGLLPVAERNVHGNAVRRGCRGAGVVARRLDQQPAGPSTFSSTALKQEVWRPRGSTRGPYMAASTSTTRSSTA